MLSILSNVASHSRSKNSGVQRKCGFCRCSGHTINQCDHPSIEELDNKILNIVAVTNMFPFLKKICIRKELELLTLNELKVLSYKFDGPDSNKKYMSCKSGLLKLLTMYYYEMAITECPENSEILEPIITNIYLEFQFDFRVPERVPDSRILRRCADIAYENMPEQQTEYFRLSNWISQQIENHYRDYTEFIKSQEFKPHRFDMFTCVQEQIDEHYEMFDCPICQEDITDKNKCVELGCKHQFCTGCITMQLETASKANSFSHPNCAMCRAPIADLYFNNYFEGESIHSKYIKKDRFLMNLVDL